MFIDKDTLINLLDRDSQEFEDYLIAANCLPDLAILEIIIDDGVTAEYLNEESNERISFPLSFDYYSSNSKYNTEEELEEELRTVDNTVLEPIEFKKNIPLILITIIITFIGLVKLF